MCLIERFFFFTGTKIYTDFKAGLHNELLQLLCSFIYISDLSSFNWEMFLFETIT